MTTDDLRTRAKQAVRECDRLAAALDRVRELHRPRHIIGRHHKCDACDVAYPCPTIAALTEETK